MEEVLEEGNNSGKQLVKKGREKENKRKLTVWRILAYFIIYSILGYVIETVFAFLMYGVIESRQSFLYGPFCAIYGVGAVVMIILLRYFDRNNYTLFIGGYIIGAVVEYLISLVGEIIFNTRWWDYSENFLNINGRICLTFSILWGLLAIYLMRTLNPRIDGFIDWLSSKISKVASKTIIAVIILIMFVDCIISAVAQSWVLTKVVVEKDLDVKNKAYMESVYEKVYSNEKEKEFVDKYWTVKTVLMAYPNLSTRLNDGTQVYVTTLYPDIHPYLYRMNPENERK